jgi:polyisoprenoid-binding protein YceI
MAETTTWTIDPAHSSVELAVKHMMFTTVRGRFKDFKGTIVVDEQNPDNSTVEVEIAAGSIDTGVADRDGHLRSTFSTPSSSPPSPSAASAWKGR